MQEILISGSPAHLWTSILAGVVGLLIGSFLNVVIYRLPKMMQRESENYVAHASDVPPPHTSPYNLLLPRSSCPHCQQPIRAMHNIPVLSYLLLHGRCAHCHTPIAASYPAVELVTALAAGALIWHFGLNLAGISVVVLTCFLIVLSVIDLRTCLLPDDLTLPLLWLGLLLNLNGLFAPLGSAVIGAAAGYLALWIIYWLFKLLTGKEGMGQGDFKLLATLGAWLGWQALPFVLLFASCMGAIVGIVLLALKKHRADTPIPFGPYLAAGGLLALLYGNMIVDFQ